MASAFGFSAGDFVAAIALCTKVAKALKDTGEASAQYQQVTLELQGLQNVLTRLVALEPNESNIDHVNTIRRLALTCKLPMQDFLNKLEKYETSLSPYSSKSLARAASRRTRYALFMSKEVETMRAMISGKVISINLLLATHASEAISRTERRTTSDHTETMEGLAHARNTMSDLIRDIKVMNEESVKSHERIRRDAESSSASLHTRLEKLDDEIESIANGIAGINIGITSLSNSAVTLRGLGVQIIEYLKAAPFELRTLLQGIVRTNMQMYTVLLEIHRKIGASPRLALESNIRVEDSFGEIRSLPFEWFKYWEPFEGLLKATFKDKPGAGRVDRGEFRLVHSQRPTILLDRNNWSHSVTPGAEITMLMIITDVMCRGSICPRASCQGQVSIDTNAKTLLTCPRCGLRFMPQPVFEEAKELNRIEQIQLEEDSKLFGQRDHQYFDADLHSTLESSRIFEMADDIDATSDGFAERGKPSTRYNLSQREEEALSKLTDRDNEKNSHVAAEPPIMTWLTETVAPANPDSVVRWREVEESRLAKQREQEAQDLEVFRNVEINLSLTMNSLEESSGDNKRLSQEALDVGARVFYRNILDRYPSLDHVLAQRLAKVNWERKKNIDSMPERVEVEIHDHLEACGRERNPSKGRDTRRISTLPPPPMNFSPEFRSWNLKCYLCAAEITVIRKQEWRNHVMDDLRPYLCLHSQCVASEKTYSRRKLLFKHMNDCHADSPLTGCPFCGYDQPNEDAKNPYFVLLKHIGHHLEEISFGVISTAYEQWSYQDSDSGRSANGWTHDLEKLKRDRSIEIEINGNWGRYESPKSPLLIPTASSNLPPPPLPPPQFVEDFRETDPVSVRTKWDDVLFEDFDYFSKLRLENDGNDEENYWTRRSHPSSSASSANNSLRDSFVPVPIDQSIERLHDGEYLNQEILPANNEVGSSIEIDMEERRMRERRMREWKVKELEKARGCTRCNHRKIKCTANLTDPCNSCIRGRVGAQCDLPEGSIRRVAP